MKLILMCESFDQTDNAIINLDAQEGPKVINCLRDNNLSFPIEAIRGHNIPAMCSPNKIYLTNMCTGKFGLFIVLHEFGHVLSMKQNNIWNYPLLQDTHGNPISEEAAIKLMVDEEQNANRWAFDQIDKYKINIPKVPYNYNTSTAKSVINTIRSNGWKTVEEIISGFRKLM